MYAGGSAATALELRRHLVERQLPCPQVAQRRQARRRRQPGAQRILEGLLGEVLLGALGQQGVDDRQCLGRGAQYADARQVDEARHRPGGHEVVGGWRGGVLGQGAEQVVVVHQPEVDLAGDHRLDDGAVLRVATGLVGPEPGKQRRECRAARDRVVDRQVGLEGGVGGGEAKAAVKAGLDDLFEARGQLLGPHPLGVVDQAAHPAGEADPVALAGADLRRHPRQDLGRQAGEEAGAGQSAQRRRIL
jgi:hypothetical protein